MRYQKEFASTIVDLGMIVGDIGRSVDFYVEAIGFTEVVGFSVPQDLAGDSGLTDHQPIEISVLKLESDESVPSTDLKLMQFPGLEIESNERSFVHARHGINYMSLFVTDIDVSLERLERAGVTPQGKGAVTMPFELGLGTLLRPQMTGGGDDDFLDRMPDEVIMAVVRDPDGNFVELLGPRYAGE